MHLIPLSCSAYEVKGSFVIADADKVSPFRVQLNGGEQVTYARADGTFSFRNVEAGRHVIDIPSDRYMFSQVWLD